MRAGLLLVVLGLALAIRLWVLLSLHFDGLYGQDAFAYYYHATALWRDHALTYPWPWLHRPLPLFFPLGESALLATVFALLGHATPTAALAVSVICGVATVGLVYGLTLRVADRLFGSALASATAALAAAPISLAGLQVQASATIMSDAPALFWTTAALWLWTLPDPSKPYRVHPARPVQSHRLPDPTGEPPPRLEHTSFKGRYAPSGCDRPAETRPAAVTMPAGLGVPEHPATPPVGVRRTLPSHTPHRGFGGPGTPIPTLAAFAAGICYALAVSTRWENALLALPMGAYLLAVPQASRRLAPAVLGAILAGMPQSLYSLHYSDPVLHHQWLTGWSPLHLWQTHFATVDGVQHYSMSPGAFYLLRPLLSPQSLPFPLAPFLPLGIAALAGWWPLARPQLIQDQATPNTEQADPTRRISSVLAAVPANLSHPTWGPPNHTKPVLLLLLCWWLAPTLYLAGVPFESARFTLVYLPPLAILEAIGFVATVAALAAWTTRHLHHAAILAVLWAACSLAILAFDARGGVEALAKGKEGDLAAVRWLRSHAQPGAPIATFGLTLMLYHYGDPVAHRWTLLDLSAATPSDLAHAAHNPALIVVVNEANLAAQWRGLPPQQAFAWLQAYAPLRPQTHTGGYTIFRHR